MLEIRELKESELERRVGAYWDNMHGVGAISKEDQVKLTQVGQHLFEQREKKDRDLIQISSYTVSDATTLHLLEYGLGTLEEYKKVIVSWSRELNLEPAKLIEQLPEKSST